MSSMPMLAMGQHNCIKSDRISSLQVVAGKNWLSMPITSLYDGDPINVSFDDLTHEYHRYVYKLEHCEHDWTMSEGIFESDFCEGFTDGNIIDDVEESINTNIIYTHYSFSIPNESCHIKMSGNYKISVYDENSGDTVFTTCFMVYEPRFSVNMKATTNTDIDTNKSHQQIAVDVGFNGVDITRPEEEIHAVVMQNYNWHTAKKDVRPQYITKDGMRWEHERNYIFDGGNEYRKFEILDVSHPTLGIEDVWWDGANYHALIWKDYPRTNYTYDEDTNGFFYIRNSNNVENDRTSEYVLVDFTLETPRQNGNVYVDGKWTNVCMKDKFLMTFNESDKAYHATIMLKQGYYSYRYILETSDGDICGVPSEGNFFQTENEYQALIYYKGIGKRTDLLLGYKSIKLK